MTKAKLSRRQFLRRHAAGAAAVAVPLFVPAGLLAAPGRPGANDRVEIGLIGTGIRGRYLIGNVPEEGRVVALCDCYRPRMLAALRPDPASVYARVLERFVAADAERCALFQDYRQMIDRAKLDAVMIATPDHHHVLTAMVACQAGLDLYVEKPLSLTVAEGRRLVEAVARCGRVCQVGSQQRSMEMNRFACRFIRDGRLGRISAVEVQNFAGPLRYEGLPEEPLPEGMDWPMYCGPTPLRPYNWQLWQKDERKLDGRNWRGWDMWRSYSGHLMTNWGAHSIDQVQWALGADETGPIEIGPLEDDYRGEPRLRPVAMRYADGVELRFTAVAGPGGGAAFYGERGRMIISRNSFRAVPADLVSDPPDPSVAAIWAGIGIVARPHVENWLACIKTRGTPAAPAEVGHRAITVCHLAGIARELGRPLRWDPAAETFPGDDEANALLDRPRRKGFELPTIG